MLAVSMEEDTNTAVAVPRGVVRTGTPAETPAVVPPATPTVTPAVATADAVLQPSWDVEIEPAFWTAAAEASVFPFAADPRVAVSPLDDAKDSDVKDGDPDKNDPTGVFQLLRTIRLGYKGPVVELVVDRARYERFFPRGKEGPTVPGAKYLRRPDDVVTNGATLRFEKGVFRLRNLMHYRRWFPKDVTIRGAGMEQTLLYMDPVRSQETVRNLRIQDCTVFVNGTILDLANGPATLRCERVRFLGFDSSPPYRGQTPAFVTTEAALYFIECRFEGGYGDRPSQGRLLDSWSALVVRFERCRLSRLHLDLIGDPATMVFVECVLEDLWDDPRQQAADREGVRFLDCRFENNWLHQRRRLLYLEVLFPKWRERMVE
ncbi:MAG: hypothetical protein ACYS5W_02500 [Planctomycetota bacterium]